MQRSRITTAHASSGKRGGEFGLYLTPGGERLLTALRPWPKPTRTILGYTLAEHAGSYFTLFAAALVLGAFTIRRTAR